MEWWVRRNEEVGCDEVSANVGKLKAGKSPGGNEIEVEYSKRVGESVVEWLIECLMCAFREKGVSKE